MWQCCGRHKETWDTIARQAEAVAEQGVTVAVEQQHQGTTSGTSLRQPFEFGPATLIN